MPVIARFYGILIKMYFSQSEHGIPHFHAIYGEYNAVFAIETLEMLEGDLPSRAQRLVKEWESCTNENSMTCGASRSLGNFLDWSRIHHGKRPEDSRRPGNARHAALGSF